MTEWCFLYLAFLKAPHGVKKLRILSFKETLGEIHLFMILVILRIASEVRHGLNFPQEGVEILWGSQKESAFWVWDRSSVFQEDLHTANSPPVRLCPLWKGVLKGHTGSRAFSKKTLLSVLVSLPYTLPINRNKDLREVRSLPIPTSLHTPHSSHQWMGSDGCNVTQGPLKLTRRARPFP